MGNSGSAYDRDVMVYNETERARQPAPMMAAMPQPVPAPIPQQYQMAPVPRQYQVAPVQPERVYPMLEVPRSNQVEVPMDQIPILCPGHAQEMQPARVNLPGFGNCMLFGRVADPRYPNSAVVAILSTNPPRAMSADNKLQFVRNVAWIVDQASVTPVPSVVSAVYSDQSGMCVEFLYTRHLQTGPQLRKKVVSWAMFMDGNFEEAPQETAEMTSARDAFMRDRPDMFTARR